MTTVRQARAVAAAKYKPEHVRLLLVAEAPPASDDRYFYFREVTERDDLFMYVCKVVFGAKPPRSNKEARLADLMARGVFLIDLKEDALQAGERSRLKQHVPDLADRVLRLQPDAVVLIAAKVYDAAYEPLRTAGVPVINVRIPFPGSGRQKRFEEAFVRAVALTGMSQLSAHDDLDSGAARS